MTPGHKTEEQILAEIEEATTKIEVGASYCHYKDRSKVYKIQGFGTLEADDSLCVIYQAQYGKQLTFIRPVSIWLEQIEWQGKKVPRFTKV